MNTSKIHYCLEGEQREILLGVFTRFCRFSKGAFGRKSSISTGRNGRLKLGKLLNLDLSATNKTFQYHCFDIQRAGFFQTLGVFIDSPGIMN